MTGDIFFGREKHVVAFQIENVTCFKLPLGIPFALVPMTIYRLASHWRHCRFHHNSPLAPPTILTMLRMLSHFSQGISHSHRNVWALEENFPRICWAYLEGFKIHAFSLSLEARLESYRKIDVHSWSFWRSYGAVIIRKARFFFLFIY